MGEPKVRRLTRRDIDIAIALTDLESWGYTRADFERLLALAPQGCFAVEDQGRVVGVLTTTSYGRLAFLGAVIVQPEYRGRGIGKRMMEAALHHLSRTGVETVRLNAYLNVIPFYEGLGFQPEYEVVRWSGRTEERTATGVRPMRNGDLPHVTEFDASYFGASRRQLLGRLFREVPEGFLVAEEGDRILGYIAASVSDHACEIGPWVVAPGHPDLARQLFHGVAAVTRSEAYALSGPTPNSELSRFLQQGGFREVFRSLRMWRGKNLHPGQPAGIWAAAGLEKG